jgi:hypothetical protein
MTALRRANRKTFLKKKEAERTKVVKEYFRLKGQETENLAEENLARQSQRIDSAHPQMPVFKIFKALMDKKIVGVEGFNPTTQLRLACEVFFSGAIDTPGDF